MVGFWPSMADSEACFWRGGTGSDSLGWVGIGVGRSVEMVRIYLQIWVEKKNFVVPNRI